MRHPPLVGPTLPALAAPPQTSVGLRAVGGPSRQAAEVRDGPTLAMMLESDGPGGAEVLLLQLSEELRGRGCTIVPVLPAVGVGWLGARFAEKGFEVETFSIRGPLDPACLWGLARTLRRKKVDLVHSHEFTMSVYGAAAAKLVRRPHVLTMHAKQGMTDHLRRRLALRWAFRNSVRAVAVSDDTRTHLESELGLAPAAITTVRNGIPLRTGARERLRSELGLAPDCILLLAVGNLQPRKGHRVLLRALAAIRAHRPELPWHLAIAGRGQEAASLAAFAADAGLADRVALLGHREDVPDLHAAADVFVMPSLWEGLPLALLEAMAAGTAVVASAVSGIPEAVTFGVHGLLVPPGDDKGLEQALEIVLTDHQLRRQLGAAARRRARSEFTLTRMADDYQRIYEDALASAGLERAPLRSR